MGNRLYSGITSNELKILACLFMVCDHVGLVLMNNNWVMRAVGRLAFPVFVFLLVEGYKHTSNIRNYFIRLLLGALISEIPFDLAFYRSVFDMRGQNVFFTLAAGLIVIYCEEIARKNRMLAICIIVITMAAAWVLRFDYSVAGILIIAIFYQAGKYTDAKKEYADYLSAGQKPFLEKLKKNVGVTIASAIVYFVFFGIRELYAVLSMLPISMYNGNHGKRSKIIQYGFYAFYPVHLLVLYFLALL